MQEPYQEMRESSAALFSAPSPKPAPRELLRAYVTGMAALYRERRGTLRELVQRSRSSEER